MKKIVFLLFAVLVVSPHCVIATTSYYLTDLAGSDEINLTPLEEVELLLWYTGEPIIGFDVEVNATGPGTILGGEIIPEVPACDVYIPSPYGGDIELVGTADDSFPTGISNPLAAISFRCDGSGDVTLELNNIVTVDADWNEIIPVCNNMTVHQTPEPATAILLCLGGLLIRTKKQ